MRPSPDCRPAVGAYGPPRARVVGAARASDKSARAALKRNFHRAAVESFADDLNTRRGIVSGRVALLPRSTEIQPFVASIRPLPPFITFSFYAISVWGSTVDV
ncbi:hypothetical protein V6N13_013395 [Hibiscus sabdariffa]